MCCITTGSIPTQNILRYHSNTISATYIVKGMMMQRYYNMILLLYHTVYETIDTTIRIPNDFFIFTHD
jgi:hypothetical protein